MDAGNIIYRQQLDFEGHELIDEMREALAMMTFHFCQRFLDEDKPPNGTSQNGKASYHSPRRPADSVINPALPISEQFNLFRVVDNDRYPAFFDWQGHRYRLHIEKMENNEDGDTET